MKVNHWTVITAPKVKLIIAELNLLSFKLSKQISIELTTRKRRLRWSHGTYARHILLAEEMANWLKSSHFSWLGKLEKINSKTFQEDLDG